MGILGQIDVAELEAYCRLYDEWKQDGPAASGGGRRSTGCLVLRPVWGLRRPHGSGCRSRSASRTMMRLLHQLKTGPTASSAGSRSYCCHVKGEWAGRPLILAPWERQIVHDIFGPVDRQGRRKVRTALIGVPRKNGKSTFGAALALYAPVRGR